MTKMKSKEKGIFYVVTESWQLSPRVGRLEKEYPGGVSAQEI